ncbi:hypothetical protein B0T26DRAFT_96127 [Lasiosphaeria miniovina]|uniref:Uncharacterized protein n=1 Tax=Lasiosphaeria miniovina TaxID=1954250 RepID=A0AA40BJ44_9PEZI|nr:uncharacterized protein B0T26DRAFT_96127 [Lasiosphaeria miniovina]KAK0735122.1 hypothetical protein B0T26DRAFT_96127 [Lasiosphaeria miniovina]
MGLQTQTLAMSLQSRAYRRCAWTSEKPPTVSCVSRLPEPRTPREIPQARRGPSEDISFRESHDVAYVRGKFPRSDGVLAEALGKSITRRREFFRCRKAHHDRLAQGLEKTDFGGNFGDNVEERDDSHTEIVQTTVASPLAEHLKTQTDIDLRSGVIVEPRPGGAADQ